MWKRGPLGLGVLGFGFVGDMYDKASDSDLNLCVYVRVGRWSYGKSKSKEACVLRKPVLHWLNSILYLFRYTSMHTLQHHQSLYQSQPRRENGSYRSHSTNVGGEQPGDLININA